MRGLSGQAKDGRYSMISLTNRQARQFMLRKHGLLGTHRFAGKQGVLDFIRQAGCVQYDPVDVCGRTVDITLNARVDGYTKAMLDELLYQNRKLVDCSDKQLSVMLVEDLPVFLNRQAGGGYAEMYDSCGGEAVQRIAPQIRKLIAERGHVSAADIAVDGTIEWKWSIMASLPRVALESMYFRGELIVHHKTGTNKSYALMKDYVPANILNAPLPFETEEERLAWHVKRRIGAVGMLWNRASDAFLGLRIKTAERTSAFTKLLADGAIFEAAVEGIKDMFYILEDDRTLLEAILSGEEFPTRTEFLAPLDNLMWDRKLIQALFGFAYTWEIYTPAVKRKYGAYVLPILHGDQFVGRIEAVCERKTKTLVVKNIWYEDSVRQTKKLEAAVDDCLKRFAMFNGCETMMHVE